MSFALAVKGSDTLKIWICEARYKGRYKICFFDKCSGFLFSIEAYNIDEKFTIDRYTFTIFLGEKEEKKKLK